MARSENDGRDEILARVLAGMPRVPPPEVPLEAILERWRRRRRRTVALGGLAIAAGVLALALFPRPRREAPIYLDLRVVDVAGVEEQPGVAGEPLLTQWTQGPGETEGP